MRAGAFQPLAVDTIVKGRDTFQPNPCPKPTSDQTTVTGTMAGAHVEEIRTCLFGPEINVLAGRREAPLSGREEREAGKLRDGEGRAGKMVVDLWVVQNQHAPRSLC